MIRQFSALGMLVAALLAAWAWISQTAVTGERARVESRGKKTDAKASAARTRAQSDADRVLKQYCRDC